MTALVRSRRPRRNWWVLLVLVLQAPASALAQQASELENLRTHALDLVNESRQAEGLALLNLGINLNEAAQAHARDMLDKNYYAHASPEGDTVQDRFMEAGGGQWGLVAENIARCAECSPPPEVGTIEQLHEGWMNSPEHRANILAQGLERFGFGIVIDADQGLYAVQTFAGPGTSRGLPKGEAPKMASPAEQAVLALEEINAARREAGVEPLRVAEILTTAAREVIPANLDAFSMSKLGNVYEALPESEREDWSTLTVLAGECGGCGTEPTVTDIRDFGGHWLEQSSYQSTLLDPQMTHLGFALEAGGNGRKLAVAVIGRQR